MFWKGKVPLFTQFKNFVKQSDVSLLDLEIPQITSEISVGGCKVSVSKLNDVEGISKLLNEWFEDPSSLTKATTTSEWIRSTYLDNHAIWIVAKDIKGTIRGCVSSFFIQSPYPNSLIGCGKPYPWGIVDWYCVHPLWRSKGVGSALLEVLDFVTYRIGRKAHVFLKEGIPLAPPHIPIYTTWLKCRKAGSKEVKQMSEDSGLTVYPYQEAERSTGIPMIRVEGLHTAKDLKEWEQALDKDLPECWVFVTHDCLVKNEKGWKTDALISMYAFRWSPGKWLGSKPTSSII
jgi:GNAT superfamily N-acetyltransferase